MKLLSWLTSLYSLIKRYPEEDYIVLISNDSVQVIHPWLGKKEGKWIDLQQVLLINTDKGPWFPDVWLTLNSSNGSCKIPVGASGYDEIYNIVSTYKHFNFENVIESMGCTDCATFVLWDRNK